MSAHHTYAACPVCSEVGEYIEIENAQDPSDADESERFPPQVDRLQVPNESLARYYVYKDERLLKCFDCGTYYWYRKWAPGGSEDVLHTYIHESIRRLGFLEAHVELHDAQYQAARRAREYGGSYVDEYETTKRGVQEEMALLRAKHGEIVADVIHSLENKHSQSEELEETLKRYAPRLDHSRQIQEAREKEEKVAVYHAGILAEYLQYWDKGSMPEVLIHRLVRLLADDNPGIREAIKGALLHSLQDVTGRERTAQAIVEAAERLTPRYAETGELLDACRGIDRKNWRANRPQSFPHRGKK